MKQIKLKQIFGKNRVVACAGNRNTGKTNNIVSLIEERMATEKRIKSMNEVYGDGSPHKCCPNCGLCIDCGDCKKYGCKNEIRNRTP